MDPSPFAVAWAALTDADKAAAERALSPPAWALRFGELRDAARAAWPDLDIPDASFLQHLVARVPIDLLASAPVGELRLGDLYLACACNAGDTVAIAAFERSCLATLAQQLVAAGIAGDVAVEAAQRTRVRLLVAADGSAPKIAGYRGRGDLRAWTRTVAVHEALQLLRQARRDGLASAPRDDTAVVGADPELQHLQAKYADGFKQAFLEAFAALTPRERNILRQHLAFGMSCDQLGAIYAVHATTALRWSNKARARLWNNTRRAVQRRFALGAGDADSLIRALQERLQVTWERLISSDGDG